ncbi:MAG: sigma-54-dependent Fis family transcriptional regulator [Spirochaetes bacterium]|nr:sigma-54-dependent Fis family transcriptional regulator [Spirochaetota bacterium]
MSNVIYPENPILMIDDDESFIKSVQFFLNTQGISNIRLCSNPGNVGKILKHEKYSLILLDLVMPEVNGLEILEMINVEYPGTPVIVLTGEIKIETIVECMKKGAYDYISKPLDKTRILTVINNILKINDLKNENELLKKHIIDDMEKSEDDFSEIITNNAKMKTLFHYIKAISQTPLPVLITGETGTGKELFANAIHKISGRIGNFVKLNIASEDMSLISDTLFGHVKGSYTSSVSGRKGLVEQANGGTLFLDEIGDIDSKCQLKLLRVIQERKYYPIGSDIEKNVDVRFIFATNRDLKKMVEEERIRKDLYYRLESHHINIPSLKERMDDIPLLTDHFIDKASKILKKKRPFYTKELITLLSNYDYPGNVRELEGMIFNAISLHEKGILSLESFYKKINHEGKLANKENFGNESINDIINEDKKFMTLKEVDDFWINKALKKTGGNQTMAARLLGLSRRALNNRLSRKKNND